MKTSKFKWSRRFILRTLLVCVSLILVVLGWYLNRIERQRKTVLSIEANGGAAEFNHETDALNSNTGTAPSGGYPGVVSLRNAGTGVDYFHSVVRVHIEQANAFLTLVELGWYLNRVERQRNTVLWIEANGGFVAYDHETNALNPNRAMAPPVGYQGVASLRNAGTGVNYFHSVVRVRIGKAKTPDDALRGDEASSPVPFPLERLAGLTHLEELDIRRNVTGDLEPLRGMVNLRALSIHDVETDDFGPLAGMTQLETLYMEKSNVSDLGPLANLEQLRWVYLVCPNVRDLRPLAKLPKLDYLYLKNSKIDDLSPLLQFPKLTRLGLSGATVEDWTPLEKLTRLSGLWLDDANIEIDELERIDAKLREGAVRHDHFYE